MDYAQGLSLCFRKELWVRLPRPGFKGNLKSSLEFWPDKYTLVSAPRIQDNGVKKEKMMNKLDTQFMKKDVFDDQRRKGARFAHMTKEEKEKYFIFRELLWKAIDEKDENFSIVETAKALGMEN